MKSENTQILSHSIRNLEIARNLTNREARFERIIRACIDHLFIASNHISQFQGPPSAELVSELAVVRYKNDAMFHAQVDHMANAILTIL